MEYRVLVSFTISKTLPKISLLSLLTAPLPRLVIYAGDEAYETYELSFSENFKQS